MKKISSLSTKYTSFIFWLDKTSIFSDYEYAKIFEKFPEIMKLQSPKQRYIKIDKFGHFI